MWKNGSCETMESIAVQLHYGESVIKRKGQKEWGTSRDLISTP